MSDVPPALNDGGFWYPSLMPFAAAADRGATVRDLFAAHALTGILAMLPPEDYRHGEVTEAGIAAWAFTIADALVAKRAADYAPTGFDPRASTPAPAPADTPWILEDPAANEHADPVRDGWVGKDGRP